MGKQIALSVVIILSLAVLFWQTSECGPVLASLYKPLVPASAVGLWFLGFAARHFVDDDHKGGS